MKPAFDEYWNHRNRDRRGGHQPRRFIAHWKREDRRRERHQAALCIAQGISDFIDEIEDQEEYEREMWELYEGFCESDDWDIYQWEQEQDFEEPDYCEPVYYDPYDDFEYSFYY